MTITCYGSHVHSDGLLYAFLGNGTNQYLCKTSLSAISWSFAETAPTAFTGTYIAQFVTVGTKLIFTKGEKKQIGSDYGGVFYLNTATLAFYGLANNPTARYLEYHKERLWVGNISYLANTAVVGKSWIMASKVYPEATDTTGTISAMTVSPIAGARTYITCTSHTFNAGDIIYITGVVGTAGTSALNGKYHTITEVATNVLYIETDTYGLTYTSGGTAILNNTTWSPQNTNYDDGVNGAGIFKCDNDEADAVMGLKTFSSFLAIFRQRTVYIFTGSIETGNSTLAKQLNVNYGAICESIAITSGGMYFMSRYGLSRLEGVNIKTAKTEFDNILSITLSSPIKPNIDAINAKSTLQLKTIGDRLYLHDQSGAKTYVFDNITGQWTLYDNVLSESFAESTDNEYSVYKYFVFDLEKGYQAWDTINYGYKNYDSKYKTKVITKDMPMNTKIYKMLYALIEGSSTTSNENILNFNIYFNGRKNISTVLAVDIKTGSLSTWATALQYSNGVPAVTWNTVTTTGTKTWQEILGTQTGLIEKKRYRLGTAKSIQFEISHTDNSSYRLSKFMLDYDITGITTR